MNQTEKYVQQATRGLWGKARRELKMELEGHIAERCQEFRLAGLSAAEAQRQTLRELGAPVQVSGGMLDVYTAPALGKAGVLSALLATTVFSALPQGLAQVQGIYAYDKDSGPLSYLDFEQLKVEIEKAGGKVSGKAESTKIGIMGASNSAGLMGVYGPKKPILTKNGKTYLQTKSLFYSILNNGIDLSISGWKNPILNAGKTKIRIEAQDWFVINSMYTETIRRGQSIVSSYFIVPELLIDKGILDSTLAFEGQFSAGTVYTLVIPKLGHWSAMDFSGTGEKIEGNLNFIYSSNQAQAGAINFRVPKQFKNFKIYSNTTDFQRALEPYNDRTSAPVAQWDAKHPAPVLLLKLSGRFGLDSYTVVSPTAVKKQP